MVNLARNHGYGAIIMDKVLLNEGTKRLLDIGMARGLIDLKTIGDFIEIYDLEHEKINSGEDVACVKSTTWKDGSCFRVYYQIKEDGRRQIGAEIYMPKWLIDNYIIMIAGVPESILRAQRQKLNKGLMASHLVDLPEVQDIKIFDMIRAESGGVQFGMSYVLDNVWTTNSWEFRNEEIIPWTSG